MVWISILYTAMCLHTNCYLLTRPTKHQHHLIIIEIIAPDLSPEIVWKEYKPFHIYTFELLHRNYGKTQ